MYALLHGAKGPRSAAIAIALAMAGEGLAEPSALLRLHPVPALRLPDGTVTSRSAAIPIPLGQRPPHAGLLPPDLARHAQARAARAGGHRACRTSSTTGSRR